MTAPNQATQAYAIEKINGDNRRPGMKHAEGYLVRYRSHPDFGWTGCRTFATEEEAMVFAHSLTHDGDLPPENTPTAPIEPAPAPEKTNTPLEFCGDEQNQVPVGISEHHTETEPAGYRNGSTWYGGRYDSALSTTDICKRIRQHLKNEARKNPLFTGARFSVRKEHHSSIRIEAVEMGFNPLNPEYIQLEKEHGKTFGESWLSINGKAFMDRIEAIADSYNFDGSDVQSDYYHVNFYLHTAINFDFTRQCQAELEADLANMVNDYRQKVRDSWPACTECGEKVEHPYSTEDGQHVGLCWQCFAPHDQAEREQRSEECRREREETARQVAKVADVELIEADERIEIVLPSLNKNNTLIEYTEQRESGEYETVRGKITHRATITAEQYDILTNNLLENVPWLAGKGGCQCDIDFPDVDSVYQLAPEQMEVYRENVYTLFVGVSAPSLETIYIDPQGYDYARYVGFSASPEVNPSLELAGPVENLMPPLEFSNDDSSQPLVRISENEPEQEVIRFEVGKTYSTRSIGDHNCIYSITIAKRTAKTVTTTECKIYRPRLRTNHEGQTVETISGGNYSFAHSWDATDDKVLLRDWEQPAALEKQKQAEQTYKALLAMDNLIAGAPIDDVMEQWYKEKPQVTGANAVAFACCDPANRWNNRKPETFEVSRWQW
jgi:hypothetical protein